MMALSWSFANLVAGSSLAATAVAILLLLKSTDDDGM
jgi:hypothetical protein